MINKYVTQEKIFFWNVLGSISTAAISVFLLNIVSRLLSDSVSDTFSFAQTIGNQLIVIGLFQVRNYQATDIKEKYSFSAYFGTRIFTCLMMMLGTVIYIFFKGDDSYKSNVIFLLCLYRATDAFSDVYQGLFQQKTRMDIAGKSLFYRNCLVAIVFFLGLVFTKDLLITLSLVCLVSALFIVGYDIRIGRYFEKVRIKGICFSKIYQLILESSPLFINGFLQLHIYSQSRYSIDEMLKLGLAQTGMQKDFNILFMPAFVMNLMMFFLRPMITQMAVYEMRQDMKSLNKLRNKILLILLLFAIIVLTASGFIGLPIISLVFGTDLTQYQVPFMILMLGGVISAYATVFDNILIVLRQQKLLIISYFSAFIVSILTSNYLVRQYHILGASISFLLAMTVWLLLTLGIYVKVGYRKKEK